MDKSFFIGGFAMGFVVGIFISLVIAGMLQHKLSNIHSNNVNTSIPLERRLINSYIETRNSLFRG